MLLLLIESDDPFTSPQYPMSHSDYGLLPVGVVGRFAELCRFLSRRFKANNRTAEEKEQAD